MVINRVQFLFSFRFSLSSGLVWFSIMFFLCAGKSTLMNHLFHTSFREMDAFRGRFVLKLLSCCFGCLKLNVSDILAVCHVLVYGQHLIEYRIVADLKRPRASGLPNVSGLSQAQLLWIWRAPMEGRGAR